MGMGMGNYKKIIAADDAAAPAPPLQNPYPWPWVAFVHRDGENQIFYDLIRSTKVVKRSLPDGMLKNTHVLATTTQGWSLLYRVGTELNDEYQEYSLFLWNPVTLESIYLPKLKSADFNNRYRYRKRIIHVVLTKPPTDANCVILLFACDPPCILFCYVGDETWTQREYEEDEDLGDDDNNSYIRGDMVVCEDNDGILSVMFPFICRGKYTVKKIEIVKPRRLVIRSFKTTMPLLPSLGAVNVSTSPWVACGGDLFCIQFVYGGVMNREVISIGVFKLDFINLHWNIVDSCPNVAFFWISQESAVCVPISSADHGNRIYFSNLCDENLIYTYHIEFKTLSVSLLNDVPCSSACYWRMILPPPPAAASSDPSVIDAENAANSKLLYVRDYSPVSTGTKTSRWDHLPFDVLETIHSHLINPIDYLNFRGASKLCCSAAGSAKEWRRRMRVDDPFESCYVHPWLMINGVSHMVNPIMQSEYHIKAPENWGKYSKIHFSAYGWVLFSTRVGSERAPGQFGKRYYMCNPLTKFIVDLPLPQSHCLMDHLYFYFTTDTEFGNCQVFGVSVRFGRFGIFHPGKSHWYEGQIIREEEEEEEEGYGLEQSNVHLVTPMEDYYCFLTRNGKLGVVRINDEEQQCTLRAVDLPMEICNFEQSFLVEYDKQCLLCVYIGKNLENLETDTQMVKNLENLEWVKVFRLYLDLESNKVVSERVNDLGHQSIYLSTASSFVRWEDCIEMGSRIYFPRFYQHSIIYYSLRTCRFHVFGRPDGDKQDSVVMSYYETKYQLYSCWFEPRLQVLIESDDDEL